MKHLTTFLASLFFLSTAPSLTADGVVLTKKTPTDSEEYWNPIEFGSIENFPTSVVITSKGTKQNSTIPRHQIGEVIEFVDFNATSIVSEDGLSKIKAARDSVAKHASKCKQAAGILSAVVQNYDQVLSHYADGNVLVAGKWINKHDYAAKLKAEALASTAGSIPEVVAGAKSFKNVRVTKVVGDRISIMHEGGIASFKSGDLSEETRMRMENAFPKQFQGNQKNTSSEPEKSIADNDKPMMPGQQSSLETQLPPPLGDVPGKTNPSFKPKPLPTPEEYLEAAKLKQLEEEKTKNRLQAMMTPNIIALNEQKPKILEAVDLIKSKIAAIPFNSRGDINFSFDFATGMMSFAADLNTGTRYSFPMGCLDPGRIYLGEEYSSPLITMHTHDDEYFILDGKLPIRFAVLRPLDQVDALKLSKAFYFLASIYNTQTLTPEIPTVRMERLLGKLVFQTYKISVNDGIINLVQVRKSRPDDASPTETVIRVKLLDLDPERFTIYQQRKDAEFEASVDLRCASGKNATLDVTQDGITKTRTADNFDLWCLNRHDAERVLEDIIRLCIKAGWRRGSF